MEVILVPTTHWDREWYRTFQAFRARLVDTVDFVLDLLDGDEAYAFLLDGQTIVCEDYAEIRPERRAALERYITEGRVEIGPWYVQPDSLIPGGEAHVRNLIEGRRAGEAFGPVSRVAYTPDSFGHPAQFPQIFAGFGMGHFVYWRGNSDEIAELPAEYSWVAPDGTAICACHLWRGYGAAAGLPHDIGHAVKRLRTAVEDLAARTNTDRALLLAGTDHQPPDPHTSDVCEALSAATGWKVRRGLLADFVDGLTADGRPEFRGELLGGRIANLLPSVWSTRTYLKIHNRACETALDGWAEPWAALGRGIGCSDERPALRLAWRQLLANQAHDSICGCSQDAVHEQMLGRYDAAFELARETTARICERIAGLGPQRRVAWTTDIDIAVFNPSPHTRTDVVRFPLQGFPPFDQAERHAIHPLNWSNMRPGRFEVAQDAPSGAPSEWHAVRLVPVQSHDRVRIINEQHDWDVEFVAADVPAFGYRRFTLRRVPDHDDPLVDDEGRSVGANGFSVAAADDGTLTANIGGKVYPGLFALENTGDRGDTYDYDPVDGPVTQTGVEFSREMHSSGIQHLRVTRTFSVPSLDDSRTERTGPPGELTVTYEARVAPGVDRVDLHITVDNTAKDQRVRMLFPTGAPVDTFHASTTFDVAERSTAARDGSQWLHPAPSTFPHQGWVSANGLTVVAPGLGEGEVTADGVIAITLLRSVGWLSRMDLKTRPSHAGPALPTPAAQCLRTFEACVSLLPGVDPSAARDAELGLLATAAGDAPLLQEEISLVSIEPRQLLLTTLKPADHEDGFVLRMLNPTDDSHEAVVTFGFDLTSARFVRLDETPLDATNLSRDGRSVRFVVPPRALRSVLTA
ncbi:MAG: glycosyl hydrolase-related protein [Actinomycetota bacterium]